MSDRLRFLVLTACVSILPASAAAQGHMLHGIGPINSAMGGAGVALPNESLGALTFNPALITAAEGNQISFATEFFKDGILIDTTVGQLKGRATGDSQWNVVPAIGWMLRDPRGKLALGFGLIGLAGFGTDYPADASSVLFAPIPNGFGRIYTDYRETKIPIAVAYQVTPKLSVGMSLNLYLGEFGVAPLPYKYFDLDAAGNRYYPEAGKLSKSWAFAPQFGFHYQASPKVSVGASLTTPQNFSPYSWNSTHANPAGIDYGQPQTLEFDLDGPMIASFGLGLKPGKNTRIAIDGMFTKYKGVHGLGGPGGVNNGVVDPFGWRDVWTFKTGVQQQVTEKLVVRGGYNYSQMPLREEVVLSATGAPATFQNHFCGGFGFKMFPFLEVEASVYFVPREHAIGPFPDLQGNVIGTLDESNKLTGALIGMNFKF
ncbi:MAG TPA: outer membrane protein transport protein [Vicinamibacterales bacterium]